MPQISDVAVMLSKVLLDENPAMKKKAADFSANLCDLLKEKAGSSMKKVIESLTTNLQHQQSKVRKSTLQGLEKVIVSRDAE